LFALSANNRDETRETARVPALHTVSLFAAAALALLLIPGPAVLYIVTRSVTQGRRAGFVSVLGIHAGTLVHVAAAAFGLSAILVRSSTAFHAVKYAGAAYLILLGLRRLVTPVPPPNSGDVLEVVPNRQLFVNGAVVNILNPKTALFFLAFLPQFVDPDRGSASVQVVFFGALFVALGLCSDSTYALLASRFGSWLRTSRSFRHGQRYVAGGIYVGLGVTAALAGSRTTSASSA
jgi:threonine/homoserine/homoserine lactone efflux protein